MDKNQTHPIQRMQLSHHRLLVWHKAMELVRLVKQAPIGDAELRDHSMRACRSAALNIAEGAALEGAAKRRHFGIARASTVETVAAYELAEAIGEILPVENILRIAAEIAAMLTRLIR